MLDVLTIVIGLSMCSISRIALKTQRSMALNEISDDHSGATRFGSSDFITATIIISVTGCDTFLLFLFFSFSSRLHFVLLFILLESVSLDLRSMISSLFSVSLAYIYVCRVVLVRRSRSWCSFHGHIGPALSSFVSLSCPPDDSHPIFLSSFVLSHLSLPPIL